MADVEKELDMRLENCREKNKKHVQASLRETEGSELEEENEDAELAVTWIEKMTIYQEFYLQAEQSRFSWEASEEDQLDNIGKQAASVKGMQDSMFLSSTVDNGSCEDRADDNKGVFSVQAAEQNDTDNLLDGESRRAEERETSGCWNRTADDWSDFVSWIDRTAGKWFLFVSWIVRR